MSLESAKAFVKKMQEDDDFQKAFFICSAPEARKKFIKDNGFDFTKEEIDEARQDYDVSGGNCCGAAFEVKDGCGSDSQCGDACPPD
jgi:predicted ribosomally synthesized peptide with nif11-like leader